MSQLVSPSGFREDSPRGTGKSASPVSGQRLGLAKGLQVSQGSGGGGQGTAGPLCCLQASLPLNLHPGGQGWKRARGWRGHPGSWVRGLCPMALPIQELGSCLPPPLAPAGEELTDPQGPGVGTNGSADYRCLLIKELNPFVFLAPIPAPWRH